MRILITRPARDNDKLQTALESVGHSVISSPLLAIEPVEFEPVCVSGLNGIVVTSRNALRALSNTKQIEALKHLRAFAVGDTTGAFARTLGFKNVVTGPGRAVELSDVISRNIDPADGELLFVRGDDVAYDLAGALSGVGFNVQSLVVYRSEPASKLLEQAENALRSGDIEVVVLMSPRTARVYCKLIYDGELQDHARDIIYACISEPTATELAPLGALDIRVAQRPGIAELQDIINRI